MMVQYIIVGLIVFAAVVFLVRSVGKSARGSGCESGKCGHDHGPRLPEHNGLPKGKE